MRAKPDIETSNIGERFRLILMLALPALAENLLSTFVSMVDTMMVSGYSSLAVAAVGLVTQPRMVILSIFMSLGVSCTALISRARGRGNQEQANRILMQTLLLTGAVALVLTGAMTWLDRPFLLLLSGQDLSAQVLDMASIYFRIQIYSIPLIGFTYVINAALRGVGNTHIAFYTNAIANVVNIFFNYCLISGNLGFPEMGVAGASLATVIGQSAALCGSLFVLIRGKDFIRLSKPSAPIIDRPLIRSMSSVAIPALFEQLIMRVGMMLFTRIATSLGDLDYSVHIIAMNIQSLSVTTGIAFGIASSTLTGQSLGRRNTDCARKLIRQTQVINLAVSVVISCVLLLCGRFLASLYSADAYVQENAAHVLGIVALSNPLSNARFVYNYALRGAGDSRYTAVSTTLGILIARPLLAAIFVYGLHMNLVGLWLALVSDAVICGILGMVRWHSSHWEKIKLLSEDRTPA